MPSDLTLRTHDWPGQPQRSRPGPDDGQRTAFRRGGSAAVVMVSGRPATLDEDTVARARTLIAAGWTQQQAGEKFGVGSSAGSHALTRPRAAPPAGPGPALELPLASTGPPGQDDNQAEQGERSEQGERGQERGAGGVAAGPGATAPAGQALAARRGSPPAP